MCLTHKIISLISYHSMAFKVGIKTCKAAQLPQLKCSWTLQNSTQSTVTALRVCYTR
jgi:hypothetical protein